MTTNTNPTRNFRPSRPFGQLWQVPTFLLGVLAVSLVAANSRFRIDPALVELQRELATWRQSIDNPKEKIKPPAPDQLQTLLTKAERYPARAAEICFVIGSLYWRSSEEGSAEQTSSLRAKAEEHLEKALAKGVSEGDQPRLHYRLGMILYQQGQKLPRAIELLSQAVEQSADVPDRAYEILIAAYLKQSPPDFDKAEKVSARQLERCGENEEKTTIARLARAEVLLQAGKRHDAVKVLDRIGSTAPKDLRLKARYLQARCCETDGLWSRAIPVWKELLPSPNIVPGGKAHVLYALGLCYRNNDSSDVEIALEHWKKVLPLGGEEAQAAALRIGETRMTSDARTALKTWSDALAGVRKVGDYTNSYISLDQLREMFEAGCRQLTEAQDFQALEQAAELYQRVADPGKAELLLAQAAETLARQMLEKTPPGDATAWFAKAGQAYEQVAQLAPGQSQADYLWLSASCYQSARQFTQAARNLEKFVKAEQNPVKLAEGWLSLAEAYVALHLKDKALETYHKCIEFSDTPFGYKARYQLAVMEKERKHADRAVVILEETIRMSPSDIDRETHEKVVYLLGSLLFQEKKFDKACIYLKEATRQHPGNAAVLATRDQLADCYRKLADQSLINMKDALNDEVKKLYERKRHEWLQETVATHQSLADDLEGQTTPLSLEHRKLLRKALFSVAECYFEMKNEIPEALRRYQILQNRYRKQGEGLIACQRIWLCHGKVIEPPEKVRQIEQAVRGALKIAQADLLEMPEGSPCFHGSPDVWTRQQWIDWMGWVIDQLQKDGEQRAP